ncbi:MAG: UDP-4-amino-4,6-dideoxy-N-acetyl-beta-L-altrosamine transaminase [Rhodospirillaceae bacterium]
MATKKNSNLPYGRQFIDDDDVSAVIDVLKSNWLTTGPAVEKFESAVAARTDASYGVAVSSGTAALHCAAKVSGLADGHEAVVPALTFAATAAAVRLCGAEVRFADIDPDSWCLSTESMESVLSSRTRAVLPVDFAGQPCDWDGLNSVLNGKGIVTIADSAHSLASSYKGRPVGALADMTCFSFHPVKAITTAEGGMIMTNQEMFVQELRRVRSHGIVRDSSKYYEEAEVSNDDSHLDSPAPWYYEVQEIGLNYRISDLQCALGISQLKKLNAFIKRRNELAKLYSDAFASLDLLQTPVVKHTNQSAWHIYVIQLNLAALAQSRRQIFDLLRNRGVGVQVHYMPLHLHPYYKKRYNYSRGDFPNAEAYYDRAITIPLYPSMTDADALNVVDVVQDVLSLAKR